MRIISGDLKGRKLQSVPGLATRPTSDRVREALFSILGSQTKGAIVLDLFAGTGALGIEALSRGGHQAVFIDRSTRALAILRQNLNHCKLAAASRVIQWDISKNLNCLKAVKHTFNLVFMDPPYGQKLVFAALIHLSGSQCLDKHAIIVAEHEPHTAIDLTDTHLVLTDNRRYGQTALSFFSFQPG